VEAMSVKILIKRKVSADKTANLKELVMQLRALSIKQPGYVSGESLKNLDRPDEYLVVSTWDSLGAWKAWESSIARAQIQGKIDDLLGQKTEYEVYQYRD
jgi:heme oxygenase (mycobilin-producing)